SRPFFTQSQARVEAGKLDPLVNPVRVDLSPYQGRDVSVRWRLRCDVEPSPPAAIGTLSLHRKPSPEQQTPHILFICSDAHRYDYAFGQDEQLMPRLQGLKSGGTLFTHAYTNASWTLPSMTSVLTGLSPRYHLTGRMAESGPTQLKGREAEPGEFKTNIGPKYYILDAYPERLVSLPEYLRDVGYRTAVVTANGFYIISGLLVDEADIIYDIGTKPGDHTNRAAFEVLDALGSATPLFLLVHYMDAHEWGAWYVDAGRQEALSGTRDPNSSVYAAAVRATDQFIGQLLDRWRETMGIENSLIVFFADHGEHICEPDPDWYVLRGHGGTMQEILLHVPLLIKFPAFLNIAPDEIDTPVSLIDLVPTVLDLLDLESQAKLMNGQSLIPVARRRNAEQRYLFADYQLYYGEKASVRHGHHKLVLDFDNDRERLVDTEMPLTDKGEAGQIVFDAKVRADLLRAFREYCAGARNRTAGLRSTHVIDPQDAEERLKAMGYFE
ncbi:MAG TPA: sulfatase, partial [Candidatus Hydrogenedentes bacterium]|nr:sulfatase [Candidatus Hydrogenedentota bacterium]